MHTLPELRLWYKRVREEPYLVDDALIYYEEVVSQSRHFISPLGQLGQLHQEQPGLVYLFQLVQSDANQLEKYYELLEKRILGQKWKGLRSEQSQRIHGKLTADDMKNYVAADDELFAIQGVRAHIGYWDRALQAVCSGISARGWTINRIQEARAAGLNETFINPVEENLE